MIAGIEKHPLLISSEEVVTAAHREFSVILQLNNTKLTGTVTVSLKLNMGFPGSMMVKLYTVYVCMVLGNLSPCSVNIQSLFWVNQNIKYHGNYSIYDKVLKYDQ